MSKLTEFFQEQAYAAPWRAQRAELGVIDSFVAPAWRRTIFAWQDIAYRLGLYEGTPVNMKDWVGTLRNFGIDVDESFFGDRATVPYSMLRYSLANAAQETIDRNAQGSIPTYVVGVLGSLVAGFLDPINVGLAAATFGTSLVASSGILGARATLTVGQFLNPMLLEGITGASVAKTAIREAILNTAVLPADNILQREISGRNMSDYEALLQVAAGTVLGTGVSVGPALFREAIDLAPEFREAVGRGFRDVAGDIGAADKLWYAHTIAGQPIGPAELDAVLRTRVLDILKATKTQLAEFENTQLPADWGNVVSGAIDPQFRRTEDQWRIIREAFSPADRERLRQSAPWLRDVRVQDKFDEWAARLLLNPTDVEARQKLTDALAAMYGLSSRDRHLMEEVVDAWAKHRSAGDPKVTGARWYHKLRRLNKGRAFSSKMLADANWRRLVAALKRDDQLQQMGELIIETLRRSKHPPKDLPSGFEDLILAYRRKAGRPKTSIADQLAKLREEDPVLAEELGKFIRDLEKVGAVRFDKKGRLEIDPTHPVWRSVDTKLAALTMADTVIKDSAKYHQQIPAVLRETLGALTEQRILSKRKLPSGDYVYVPGREGLYALDQNYKQEFQDLLDLNEEWTATRVDVTYDPSVRAVGRQEQPPASPNSRQRADLPEVEPDILVKKIKENIPEDLDPELRERLDEFDKASERFFTQCLTKR